MIRTIIAALILASGAGAFVGKAYAAPTGQVATPYYMERASASHDNGDTGGGN
jgi:hypothetical protein